MNKAVSLLLNAFILLFGVNFLVKIIDYILFFDITKQFETTLYIFIFNFFYRLFMIYLYDYKKKDYFKIEWLKENKNVIILETNSILRKISRLNKIKDFFERVYWLKWVGIFIFFIGMCLIEPIFVVIYFREDFNKWNGIPDLKILIFFSFACLICSIPLFYSLVGFHLLWISIF